MKKITLYFLFTLIVCLISQTQVKSQGWQFGYLIQPQYSSLNHYNNSNGVVIEENQTFTIYTGLTANYFFSKYIGLGTGVSYGHDSQKFIYKSLMTPSSRHHYVFNMLRLPINLSFNGKIGKISLLVEGGPQFCFVTKVRDKTRYGTVDYTDNYATFQIGFHVGTGVGIEITDQFMLYLKPNFEITNYNFNHTVENLEQELPLGKSLSGNSVGLQIGITWMKGSTTAPVK